MKKFWVIPPKIETQDFGEFSKISITSVKPILAFGFWAVWFVMWLWMTGSLGAITMMVYMLFLIPSSAASEMPAPPALDVNSPASQAAIVILIIAYVFFLAVLLKFFFRFVVSVMWHAVGKEVIEVNGLEIKLAKKIGNVGFEKSYFVKEIRSLRFAPKGLKSFSGKIISSGAPKIAFDHNLHEIGFASDIETSEAKEIISLINKTLQTANIE